MGGRKQPNPSDPGKRPPAPPGPKPNLDQIEAAAKAAFKACEGHRWKINKVCELYAVTCSMRDEDDGKYYQTQISTESYKRDCPINKYIATMDPTTTSKIIKRLKDAENEVRRLREMRDAMELALTGIAEIVRYKGPEEPDLLGDHIQMIMDENKRREGTFPLRIVWGRKDIQLIRCWRFLRAVWGM